MKAREHNSPIIQELIDETTPEEMEKINKEMTKTAVEWLAEKYNYITWMRNRDEISAGTADEWRAKYLEQAKEMEKEQTIETYIAGSLTGCGCYDYMKKEDGELYYKETYGGKK
jgi:hypothetical protein